MYPNTTALEYTGVTLLIIRSDTGEKMPGIDATTLIDVSSRTPNDSLLQSLMADERLAAKTTAVGDCVAPGIIQAAVFSGHAAARRLIGDVPATGIYKREVPLLFVENR